MSWATPALTEGRAAQAVAAVRVAALPVVFFGERLVDHPRLHEQAFDLVLAGGTLYALVGLP